MSVNSTGPSRAIDSLYALHTMAITISVEGWGCQGLGEGRRGAAGDWCVGLEGGRGWLEEGALGKEGTQGLVVWGWLGREGGQGTGAGCVCGRLPMAWGCLPVTYPGHTQCCADSAAPDPMCCAPSEGVSVIALHGLGVLDAHTQEQE